MYKIIGFVSLEWMCCINNGINVFVLENGNLWDNIIFKHSIINIFESLLLLDKNLFNILNTWLFAINLILNLFVLLFTAKLWIIFKE